MKEKKHNLIYQITNLVNGKIYIGRHSTNNINDNYFGSGKEITKEVKLLGRDSFKKEILFDFQTGQEMIDKEIELLTKEFISSDSNYNLGSGQGGAFTHGEEARKKLREANLGLVSVKDADGNNLKVTKDDPRYLSGELKHNTFGTVCVKDKDGKKFRVSVDDPRWISGELVGMNTGNKLPKEKGEKHTEFMKEYWLENKHSDQAIEKMREVNKGKVTVRDKDGNEFRVSCDDERYLSGELPVACKGSVWIHNINLQKSRFIQPEKVQEFLDDGWELGLVYFNKKTVRITNEQLKINKHIPPIQLKEYIQDGWKLGYKYYTKSFNEKIKQRIHLGGKWMVNPETSHSRIIPEKLFDEYILNGWKFGKIVK